MFVQSKNPDPGHNSVSSSTNSNPPSFIDPATYMKNGEFVFRVPPEAPVFEPTVEEFLDPLAYINKIRPVAEKTGICKVKPPPEWHPPFAVDVDHFKFTPRIQKLNELDANTRVKLYFLDRLATYWNYNGGQIRIPAIDDKTVDMYSLYKLVELEGGFDKLNIEKKWNRIAARMGYVNEKTVAPLLRQYYKRLLLPYEKFEKMKGVQENRKKDESAAESDTPSTSSSPIKLEPSDEPPVTSPFCTASATPQSCRPNGVRRCTRSNCDESDTEILVSDTFKNPSIQDKNKELQRLTFYGPGPKILGSNKTKNNQQPRSRMQANMRGSLNPKNNNNNNNGSQNNSPVKKAEDGETPPETLEQGQDLLADSACMVCGKGDSEESILLCDGCDDGYHTYCLTPALTSIPKGEWRCPKCIAAVVSKATDTNFGFEQAEREYSLQQFGEMADQFKSNYFNMPVHMVPTEKVEQEYWKILASMDSNVTVEYGADLHSMDHGSGFPTAMALAQAGDENHYYKSYVESSWNLNNIPVLEGSVLGYINADISGMKIPWMYVGMCFSTFCWHNEDHWSYSINYLHWGEPKTWYGVPGFMAERFEEVMRETTPDLFQNQPDLLHQLVTILNPNILMDRGVPVYHIDQAAGEFVLTFPRAYHAGFNHGYNFAEAVNFAPVDWIPLGRECVEHYSSLHRYCVFSHDELICKMASVPDNLNSKLASATHQDMLKMLEIENRQRKALLEWGVVNAEREPFELLNDDERKCAACNTTCFLSAVTCSCSPKKVTCLRHFTEHCSCKPNKHTLRYRYTLDELPFMLEKLKEKADSVAAWAAKVHDALDVRTPRSITLSGLRDLQNEAREKHFSDELSMNLQKLLSKAITEVQDALRVDFKGVLSATEKKVRITVVEIRSYYDVLQSIPCVLPQENHVKHFLKFLDEFEENAKSILNNEQATVADVEALLKQSVYPNIEMPYVEELKNYKFMLSLTEDYAAKRKKARQTLTTVVIDELLARSRAIIKPNAKVLAMKDELLELKVKMLAWESKVRVYLSAGSSSAVKSLPLSEMQTLLKEADTIEACLSSREKLTNRLQKAMAWKSRAECIFSSPRKSPPPFLEYVDRLLEEAKNMQLELADESAADPTNELCMAKLSALVQKANDWKEEVRRLFLGDCRAYSLMEVLIPRRSEQRESRTHDQVVDETAISGSLADLMGATDVATKEAVNVDKIVSWFKVAEQREFELMRALRVKNTYKRKQPGSTYCVCNASSALTMRECTLCKDLFHDQCLKQLANNYHCSEDGGNGINNGAGRHAKTNSRIFLCPFCQRSKRPSAKLVQAALAKLQKMRVRTLESVAMQCLLDREAKWKESANELMNSPEVTALIRTTIGAGDVDAKSIGSKLSQENRGHLESLLFRGFLLELELPDNVLIYKILNRLDPGGGQATTASPNVSATNGSSATYLEQVDLELSNESCSLKNELASSHSKKRKWTDTRQQQQQQQQAAANPSPKRSNGQAGCTTTRGRSVGGKSATNNSRSARRSDGAARQSRSALATEARAKTNGVPKIVVPASPINLVDDELEVEEEEQTECDAKRCLKPSSEHVDWVQCDYCKNWLHMICIGVTKREVDSQTEFMCSLCRLADSSKMDDDEVDDEDVSDDDVLIVECTSNKAVLSSS